MNKKVSNKKTNALGYRGNVTAKILHGNKVVKVQKIHNQGRIGLFRFMSHCLGNNYFGNEAPRFLRTFKCTEALTNDNLNTQLVMNNETSDIVAFGSIEYGEGVNEETGNEYASVIYTFLVPSSQINVTQGDAQVNALCLYSLDTFGESSMNNPIAFVYLDTPLEVSSGSNLVIVWELSIENIETQESTNEGEE